jgi:hypothetical protein
LTGTYASSDIPSGPVTSISEAHHRLTPAGFKYFVPEMVGQATGGPQIYSGRPMGDSVSLPGS